MNAWSGAIALFLTLVNGGVLVARTFPTKALPSRCIAVAPATIRDVSVRWLGACVAGKAEGLGVLRVGSREPFAFMLGRMKAGRPTSGLVLRANGDYQQAMGFDEYGATIAADGEHIPEQDQVWADAVKAARGVADRFAKTGNHGSANYYRRFADKIRHGRPE